MRKQKAAKDRIVSPHDVIAAAPDVILASWCGKKVVPDKIRQRPGWDAIPAVHNGRIVEIKSALILQLPWWGGAASLGLGSSPLKRLLQS